MTFPFPIQISVFVWENPQTPATGENSAGKTPCNSLAGTRRRASRKACASTRTRHTTREAPKWTDTLSETKLHVWGFPIFLQVNSPRYIKRPAGAVTLSGAVMYWAYRCSYAIFKHRNSGYRLLMVIFLFTLPNFPPSELTRL